MTIQKNKVVTIEYTLTDESGALIESSEGQGSTFTFTLRRADVIPKEAILS